MQSPTMDIEKRLAISIGVTRYLKASEAFQEASRNFDDACETLRSLLGEEECRVLVKQQFDHYLVSSDGTGEFEVEQIESL